MTATPAQKAAAQVGITAAQTAAGQMIAGSAVTTFENALSAATTALNKIQVTSPIPPTLVLTAVANQLLTQGQAVNIVLKATGGTGAYKWGINPNLPAGLTLNTTTGVISGTPTVATPATKLTVTVQDSGNPVQKQGESFSITVAALNPPPPPPAPTFVAKATGVNECTVSWTGVSPTQLGRNGVDLNGTGPWNTGPLTNEPTVGSFSFENLVPGGTYIYTLARASGSPLMVTLLQPAVTPLPSSAMEISVSLGNAQALWTQADHGLAQYEVMKADDFYGVRIDCPMDNQGVNDATIRAAIAADLDVLLILDGYQTQKGAAAFAAFATATAKEYAPLGIHHYELLNEPGNATNWDTDDDFVNPTAYAALARAAYSAIKAADPASIVVLGGNSVFADANGAGPDANGNYVGSILPATFLTAVYAANGGTTAGLCDAIGMHPYCDPNLPSTSNNWGVFLNPVGEEGFYGDSVFAVMSAHGEASKPVWITEFGFETASVQAQGFTNALTMAKAGPAVVSAFYCFNWSDDTDGPWGLNTAAYVPKPALAAVEKFLQATPPPPPSGITWGGSFSGVYNGDANGDGQPPTQSNGLIAGKNPVWVSDYPDGYQGAALGSFTNAEGLAQAITTNGQRFIAHFPMHGGVDHCTVSYADMVAGKRDAVAIQFAKDLIAGGQANAIIPMGWEGNQANAANDPAGSVAATQHMTNVMRSVPGQKFQFEVCWAMNSGQSAANLMQQYPGDAYVDVIALDVYDRVMYTTAGGPLAAGSPYPGPAAGWAYVSDPPVGGKTGVGIGLNWLVATARAHGKKWGITEWGLGYTDQWGVGGGDNGLFGTNTIALAMANSDISEHFCIWNAFGPGQDINGNDNPNFHGAINAGAKLGPS